MYNTIVYQFTVLVIQVNGEDAHFPGHLQPIGSHRPMEGEIERNQNRLLRPRPCDVLRGVRSTLQTITVYAGSCEGYHSIDDVDERILEVIVNCSYLFVFLPFRNLFTDSVIGRVCIIYGLTIDTSSLTIP